jgi:hypothetical protein
MTPPAGTRSGVKYLLLVWGLGTSVAAAPCLASESGVTTCAIRWDAWYSDQPDASAESTARSLGPAKWQFRAPLHARILSDHQIDWSGASQKSFDNEIRISSESNLKCWLYLVYGEHDQVALDASQMNNGLKMHRNSSIKDQVNYALMVPSSLMGRTDAYAAANAAIVSFWSDSNYQSVLSGRPLLFIYFTTRDIDTHWSGNMANLANSIADLRLTAKSAGFLNPYIVVTTRSDATRDGLGADAMGAYNGPGATAKGEPWPQYERDVEGFWSGQAARTTKDSIPVLMTGWDQRPRFEHPPRFQTKPSPEAGHGFYVHTPSNKQLSEEFKHAVKFVADNATTTDPAKLMVVYSWDENDEGGNALNPTLGDPQDIRLQALSRILR